MMVLVFSAIGSAAFTAAADLGISSRQAREVPTVILPHADAPFCKHIFVPNWTGAPVSALPITKDNQHLLQSGGCSADVCCIAGPLPECLCRVQHPLCYTL